jgi:hypothetical protein
VVCFDFEAIVTNYTELVVTTREEFGELQDTSQLNHVQTLYIGARFYDTVSRTELFRWISSLTGLRTITLADDWISDGQMQSVASDFATAFPMIDFRWSYDGLAGGKHGR